MNKIQYLVGGAIIFLLLLSSCVAEKKQEQKPLVVTTIFPYYDFTREVMGDNTNVKMLLPPGSDTHDYEPTPQDILDIQNCDVFVYTGGESDEWLDNVLDTIDNPNLIIIKAIDLVETFKEVDPNGSDKTKEEEDEIDEHVWTTPKNAVKITNAITYALCGIDEKNKDIYLQNRKNYTEKLEELDAEFSSVVNTAKHKTIVFADRFPLRYFAEEYGLEYFAAFPGCSAQTEPSVSSLKFLIDTITECKITAVFHLELGNEKMAATIAEETNAEILLFHCCHIITKKDFENNKTYLDFMNDNLLNLQKALN